MFAYIKMNLMKKTIAFALLFAGIAVHAQTDWKIAGNKIKTPWADKLDPAKPLPEYPRPQMVRTTWMNLNGSWQYSILPRSQETIPASYTAISLFPLQLNLHYQELEKRLVKTVYCGMRKRLPFRPRIKRIMYCFILGP